MRNVLFGLLAALALSGSAAAAAFDRPQYWGDGVPVAGPSGDISADDAIPANGTFGTSVPAANGSDYGRLPSFVVKEHGNR